MCRVKRKGTDQKPSFEVVISPREEAALLAIPTRLETTLKHPDQARNVMDRLFPVAHKNSPEEESQHRNLLGEMLLNERRENLEAFQKHLETRKPLGTLRRGQKKLDMSPSDMRLWLHVLNDLRLLLATQLGIEHNDWRLQLPDTPEETASFLHLVRLSEIQEDLVEAMTATLDG